MHVGLGSKRYEIKLLDGFYIYVNSFGFVNDDDLLPRKCVEMIFVGDFTVCRSLLIHPVYNLQVIMVEVEGNYHFS